MVKRSNQTKCITSIIPEVLKPLRKKNKNVLEIKHSWKSIFENNISEYCYPNKIYNFNNKTVLEIMVHEEKIFELSFESDFLISKINRFYGYKHIELIKFKKLPN